MNYAQTILGLIDLTSLNDDDTMSVIDDLCMKAHSKVGNVAAICIYSCFVARAKHMLDMMDCDIKVATVVNFPHGSIDFERTIFEVNLSLDRGADEVDIVFPYHALINGDKAIGAKIVSRAKMLCKQKKLKVIIESGMLKTSDLIKLASEISIANGADFIKTSTGKVAINATLEAAKIMLEVIKNNGSTCGFKAAGGIKTVADATKYIDLASAIMGTHWINKANFRFGASGLLSDVLSHLDIHLSTDNKGLSNDHTPY